MSGLDGWSAVAELATARLASASVQAAVFIVALAALQRLAPRVPAALRCALWWLASMKPLVALVWTAPLVLALLPAAAAPRAAVADLSSTTGVDTMQAPLPLATAVAPLSPAPVGWPLLLAVAWCAGIAGAGALALRELALLRRTLRGARPAQDPAVLAAAARIARELGLARVPEVRVSDTVKAPQVSGLVRPVVLLPRAVLADLAPGDLEMTLRHELLHVRHGDLWLGLVPALARRLFFFHPLVRLAEREYALAREAACDARVVGAPGVAADAYGRLLLRFGIARRVATPAAIGAASTFHHMKRRIEMLQQSSQPSVTFARASWMALAIALLGLVPVRVVAVQEPPSTPDSPPAPAVPRAPASTPQMWPAHVAPVTPITPVTPVSPVSPVVAQAPAPPRVHHVSWHSDDDDGDAFVLLHGDSSIMSGSRHDVRTARREQKGGEDLVWFRRGEQAYVIRDAATLEQARALFHPQEELGARQAELGEKQAQLGAQQAGFGEKQAALGLEQAKLGTRQAALGAQQASRAAREARRSMSGEAAATEDDREEGKLDAEMEKLGEQMEALGREQEKFGEEQEKLGREQEKLGEEQDKIGNEQERLADEAEKKLKTLLDDAVKRGVAQRVAD